MIAIKSIHMKNMCKLINITATIDNLRVQACRGNNIKSEYRLTIKVAGY